MDADPETTPLAVGDDTTPLALEEELLVWREVDEQVIVLDKRNSNYLAINDSGALLWKRIASGATRTELVASLQADYGLDRPTAVRDVDRFVSKMREHGLLRAAEGPGG
jgi:hypothetical protein